MLLDVTAFLSTSSTLGTVAEAIGTFQNIPLAVVALATMTDEQSSWHAALDAATVPAVMPVTVPATLSDAAHTLSAAALPAFSPDPLIGPKPATARVAAAKLPSLRGVELLDQMALLNRSELGTFVTHYPDVVADLITNPPPAGTVAGWWVSMPPVQQKVMTATAPKLVGSLEGAAYAQRDAANRSVLSSTEIDIRARLNADGVGRAAKAELNKRLHMLEQVREALKQGTSGNHRSLIGLDVSGGGRAVIAIGNVSTADYVDYLIPGMFSDVDTQIKVLAGGADEIATEQQAVLKGLNPELPASQLPSVATLAWIGYQTPNIVNVASMQLAREGQVSLTASLEGLRADRAELITTNADGTVTGKQPYVAILAHSYGTTAAMLSLQDDAVSVDALAIVGSPGSPARTAGDLNVTDGNVWVGAGDTDPVPQTGLFGSQPTSAGYGAHRFGVNGATDPLTGAAMSGVVGHDGYFVTGSESLRNMVLIGIGRGDLVLGLDGSSALSLSRAHGTVPRGLQL